MDLGNALSDLPESSAIALWDAEQLASWLDQVNISIPVAVSIFFLFFSLLNLVESFPCKTIHGLSGLISIAPAYQQ
jgi:hypothetical protein